jgi:adenylate cyclase
VTSRILVVDDEPDLEALVTQKFRRQIRDGSVSFVFARDGLEALALIASDTDIDMMVTDINMPRMDGLSLLQKVQEAEEQLSTIIVSAYGDAETKRQALESGAAALLTKPIDFASLRGEIEARLGMAA